ncbi:MAG: hypothetical protein P1U40_07260 [Coxiellaceae bacterium]|nr:hypothetical protein [Coxiellaceae bacterium]
MAAVLAYSPTVFGGGVEVPMQGHFYSALNVGVMQATFDINDNMLDNAFPSNISTDANQQAFSGGIAVGYLSPFCSQFIWGVELSTAAATGSAYMQDASTQISENVASRFAIDMDVIAGLHLSERSNAYVKLGPSTAYVQDTVRSPVGFAATYTDTNRNQFLAGLNFGIGVSHSVLSSLYLFAEYNFHHYPQTQLPNFSNYAATYSHDIELTSNTLSVGIGTNF